MVKKNGTLNLSQGVVVRVQYGGLKCTINKTFEIQFSLSL